MTTGKLRVTLIGMVVLLGLTASANAGPVAYDFTFDTSSTPSCTGVANGAGATGIQTYMDCMLGGSYVTVSAGALASKGTSLAPAGYNGDGFVVGPGTGGTSLTLGDSNGATKDGSPYTVGSADAFIINNGPTYGAFTFAFQNGFTIAAGSTISFDYEIFPDGSCPSLSNCGTNQANLPDFIFQINGVTQGSALHGVVPGTGGTYSNSPSQTSDTAPQALGVFTETITSTLLNPSLSFIDWPAEIGIDNLKITPPPQSPVPEPTTVLLFGTGIAAMIRRRKKAAR